MAAGLLRHADLDGLVVLVSRRAHYSLGKSSDLLGLGQRQLIAIPVTAQHKIDLRALREEIARLRAKRLGILAIVGIAGTTETGTVDPLETLADLAAEGAHFHVDAAWGGPPFSTPPGSPRKRAAEAVTMSSQALYVPSGRTWSFKDVQRCHRGAHANYVSPWSPGVTSQTHPRGTRRDCHAGPLALRIIATWFDL